jgi:hypothetical protein
LLSYKARTISFATLQFPQADAGMLSQAIEENGIFPWHARCTSQGHDRAALPENRQEERA